jgi:2-haloacid dehalogenase
MLDFKKFEVLTFDCYGTLIDWESGILNALAPLLKKFQVEINNNEILETYASFESQLQEKYLGYGEILKKIILLFAEKYGFKPYPQDLNCLLDSVGNWLPFPDTVDALTFMKKRFKLAIISNIDENLFEMTARHLKVKFDNVITAEYTKSYKPSLHNFNIAIDRIGVPPQHILHIAQSIYHDIIPAKKIGLATVWVNRRKNLTGPGATPPAEAKPDLEVPDLKKLTGLMNLTGENSKPKYTKSAGGVVINQKGQILVVSQHGTSWSLPKGHIDDGEERLEAAKREIYEESGITNLSLIKELGSYERFRIGVDGGEDKSELKNIFMYLFRTEQEELKPIDPENPEALWVEKNQVIDLLTHQKDKQFFSNVIEQI